MTVALDTRGADAVREWIAAAAPEHPSLIDSAHALGSLLGVTNVPSGTWIDERGIVVRPPEPASPSRVVEEAIHGAVLPEDAPARRREALAEARRIRFEPERYVAALRDWVALGAASRFALGPEEVVRRSAPRSRDVALAAAHFEMGQHLARLGAPTDAVPHFREALRLQPDNWTFRRQAWSLVEPGQDPRALYGSDWLDEVRRVGAENYYAPLRM